MEQRVLFLRREFRESWMLLVDRAERVTKELCRRERQLITLRRRTRLPGAAAIQAFTGAPRAAELLVDVVGDTGGGAAPCAA
jgi:hypothetical protein